MRVIPVLDVRRGRAVHAVAGDRDHYGPLRSVVHPGSDPIDLARAGRDAWALPDLYLADLDAILGRCAPNRALFRAIRKLGLTLWVDAGVRDPGDLASLLDVGVDRIIVGLETVRGPEALGAIVAEAGPERVVFSLDLHRGRPMVDSMTAWGTDRAEQIASRAIEVGVVRLIRLDLARVGTGLGVAPLDRPSRPGNDRAEWLVGGGIAGVGEIRALDRQGVSGVLVGSALHDGRITRRDLGALSGE